VRDPLRERFAWRVWPAFDPQLLTQIAEAFVGRQDFAAFGSAPGRNTGTTRTVLLAAWQQVGLAETWQFQVAADAFLYRMVRRLVYVQVAVAQGRCSTEAVIRALDPGAGPSQLPAGLAPAYGLELVQVEY
jgi:tRNA pseudouridine38-40 synthase